MVFLRGALVDLGVLLEGFVDEEESGGVVGHQNGLQCEHACLLLRMPIIIYH